MRPDQRFTRPSRWIDADHPAVRERALELAQDRSDPTAAAKARYASEVLELASGICWAKSHRLDARGLRPDLESEFDPPREVLPYRPSLLGERSFPGLWAEPVAVIRSVLERNRTRTALWADLADAEDLGTPDLSLAWAGSPTR